MTPALGKLGVVGHAAIQERLAQYLLGGRHHPAVILAGETALPKWELARNAAKALLCGQRPPGRLYCDQCTHCRRIEKEIHPDVLCFRLPDEDTIKIDTVRDICYQMEVGPVEQSVKVCLIEESHRLNAAAANAFLKTLEEPGPGRYFWLLTSQIGAMLPTILSRCLKFQLAPVGAPAAYPAEFGTWFEEFLSDRLPFRLSAHFKTKEETAHFVRFLQHTFHQRAMASLEVDPSVVHRQLTLYDQTLDLEARLRSNANYALMLESFLTQNF